MNMFRELLESSYLQTKHFIYTLAADLLHIRIGNLNWCKCWPYKNKAREIDCLFCRGMDAMFIALAKIPERKRSISSSSFYGYLPDY